MSTALASNSTLRALRLCRAWVTDAGAVCLARGLRDNAGLHRLELAYDKIEVNGGAALAGALANKAGAHVAACPLRHLDLSHNRLGDLGMATMAPDLAAAPQLQELLLQDCDIGAAGASASKLLPERISGCEACLIGRRLLSRTECVRLRLDFVRRVTRA